MIENKTPQLYGQISPSSGGTSNYNDLKNIPTINEVPLKGDLTTEDLKIDIPDTSKFITKEVNNLTNYTTTEDLIQELDDREKDLYEDIGGHLEKKYYDKTKTDELLDEKQPTGDYALKSEIPSIEGLASEEYVDGKVEEVEDKIPDVSSFITKTVDDLVNYYKKSETYTQEEVNTLIGNLHSVSIKVVDTLPETGETNIIYFVPSEDPKEKNVKDEYIYVNNEWEKIGSTDIDLTGYVTETMLNEVLQAYITTASLTEILQDYALKTEIPDTSGFITEIPIASADTLGGIKVGEGLEIDEEGVVNALGGGDIKEINEDVFVNNLSEGVYKTTGSYKIKVRRNISGTPIVLSSSKGTVVHITATPYLRYFTVYPDMSIRTGTVVVYFGVVGYQDTSNQNNKMVKIILNNYDINSAGLIDNIFEIVTNKDVLTKNNTTEYTPTGDYNPAPKKYVDDTVSNALGDISTVLSTLTTVSEVIE